MSGDYDLHLGDCIDQMGAIPDGTVDLVLTDPPYGTTACKWDAVIPFEPMWREVWRVLKANGAAVFTASQPFTSALVMSDPQRFKYALVWEKTSATGVLDCKFRPLKAHEDVAVFSRAGCSNGSKPPMPYHPQMSEGRPYVTKRNQTKTQASFSRSRVKRTDTHNEGTRYPRSVMRFKNETGMHPTQKPVALMEYLIRTYTTEGETVLDFTMGSGTTGVACVNTGRQFIGIERDKDYFDIARKRIEGAHR